MEEILFYIEDEIDGGYTASAVNYSIFTQGDTIEELRANISDAVKCHFAGNKLPKIIRLHFVRQEVFALV